MSWVVAGVVGGASALLGAYQAEQTRKAQAEANKQQGQMAAAQTEYSPWTGMPTGQANLTPVTGDALSGALQGGIQGTLAGAMFSKGLEKSKAAQEKTSNPENILPAQEEEIQAMGYQPPMQGPYRRVPFR